MGAVKRGLSGKTRRGSPPLARQRAALRVVQLTLVVLALGLAIMAVDAWSSHRRPPGETGAGDTPPGAAVGTVVGLGAGALGFGALAIAMGFRTVRGPEPPRLD